MRPRAKPDQGPLWPSYADLMTSLFCVMLVLFVLNHWLLTVKYRMSAQKWARIQEIEESVKQLADTEQFVYQKDYKRYVLAKDVQFEPKSAVIPVSQYAFLESAGKRLSTLIDDLKRRSGTQIKYLIIIEGMASLDNYTRNDELSYGRALALYQLWQKTKVDFDGNIAEVIIAGSGTRGVGRYGPSEEKKNQRFLIQVIPKVGDGWGTEPVPARAARGTAAR